MAAAVGADAHVAADAVAGAVAKARIKAAIPDVSARLTVIFTRH
jgi:hypothetical protein